VNKQGFLKPIIERLQNAGRRVSLFLDPEPALIDHVVKTGADRIELYTGPYAENEIAIEMYAETAKRAIEANLGVNAGHDLNLDNLAKFLIAVPDCAEVSIGHAITADALKMGWPAAVAAYLTAIKYAQNKAPKEDAA
jgi:pyridoxine 5-phosphate synthase